jgi:hypothetical protein
MSRIRRIRILRHLPAVIKRRAMHEVWLADLDWPFPTWQVRARPFDWAIDA